MPPASATAFERGVDRGTGDFALAGEAVVAAQVRGRDARLVRIPIGRGRVEVLVRRGPVASGERATFSAVAASPAAYAFVFTSEGRSGFPPSAREAFAARNGAAPRSFGGCAGGTDVDGPLAVAAACGLRLMDTTGDAAPADLAPPPASSPRIAGRYVSWVVRDDATPQRARIVVHDRSTGTATYEARVDGYVGSYDLQADGAVAVAVQRPDTATVKGVYAASPRDPQLRRLALPARANYAVRLARGRVAFMQWGRDRRDRATVGVLTLGGGARTLDRRAYAGVLSFDGRRVAWLAPRPRRRVALVVRRI